ncbi:MAG: serine hydrolase [Maribacter sp.]
MANSVYQYLPELKGSTYENITIKNLLQMSSGVSWNEDYSDNDSDINRFGCTLA